MSAWFDIHPIDIFEKEKPPFMNRRIDCRLYAEGLTLPKEVL